MPMREILAFCLIAIIVLALAWSLYIYAKRRRRERLARYGSQPRTRRRQHR